MKNFASFGLSVPEILLPKKDIPLSHWAVVACDQYTQDENYWARAAQAAGDGPSTLELILPEVYLNADDKPHRIVAIRTAMDNYLAGGVFRKPVNGFVYVERTTEYGRLRKGLVAAVDLDAYEWKPGTKALVRATEATIPDRIPPRMEIRRGAALELPHIMLLVNDKAGRLVESCGEAVKAAGIAPAYEGDLMLNAGRIAGWPVTGELLENCRPALEKLAAENTDGEGNRFLFAVGDGNHSLATAKAVWEEYKNRELAAGCSAAALESCPLRYALTEIVNIYDEGLTFEPIHRVLFHADPAALMEFCTANLDGELETVADGNILTRLVAESSESFGFVFIDDEGRQKFFRLKTSIQELAVSCLQPVLDEFLRQNPAAEIDYIHGTDEVFRLGGRAGAVAVLLPPVAKDSFFATIAKGGPLPRKSFSMGEASEKRFYLEARKIATERG